MRKRKRVGGNKRKGEQIIGGMERGKNVFG
jgi:hypothetical protein